jgi:hypothetical protein
LRLCALENRLDLGCDWQGHSRYRCWFGFSRLCALENGLDLGCDWQGHSRHRCWFGFLRLCALENGLDLGCDLQGHSRHRYWAGFLRLCALEFPHPFNRALPAATELVGPPNTGEKVLSDDKKNDGCTAECNIPRGVKDISHDTPPAVRS